MNIGKVIRATVVFGVGVGLWFMWHHAKMKRSVEKSGLAGIEINVPQDRTNLDLSGRGTLVARIPELGLVFTNCVQVTNHEPGCVLIRWVQDGRTNDFHAWAVRVETIVRGGK